MKKQIKQQLRGMKAARRELRGKLRDYDQILSKLETFEHRNQAEVNFITGMIAISRAMLKAANKKINRLQRK